MGKNKRFGLKRDLYESELSVFEDIPSLSTLDNKIRFSFKHCDTGKFCIRYVTKDAIEKLYKRLGHFEEITWKDVRKISHEKGFSSEKKKSGNYKWLDSEFPQFTSFLHFRVYGLSTPFRVFAAQRNDLCYLLYIDKDGSINH